MFYSLNAALEELERRAAKKESVKAAIIDPLLKLGRSGFCFGDHFGLRSVCTQNGLILFNSSSKDRTGIKDVLIASTAFGIVFVRNAEEFEKVFDKDLYNEVRERFGKPLVVIHN